jgi:pimeloyl-ACP methyl ester carboxylesterase
MAALLSAPLKAQCLSTVAVNQSISGSLSASCTSAHRSGRYARYYAFTVNSTSTVSVSMSSGVFDTYLYLLSGNGTGGAVVTSNDDYSGTDSRVSQTLSPGTYTVEATSYALSSGSFVLQISGSSSGGGGGSCQTAVALNQSISGALDALCTSAHRGGRFAKYFTFSVSASTLVTISMNASSFDTYLFLLSGTGSGGTAIASNDDYDATNSRISQTLPAGTYTIEATSYDTSVGIFTLQLSGTASGGGSGGGACQSTVAVNQSISGTLDSACASIHRSGHYARYFTFTVSSSTVITVDMTSATFDTYLFLLAGGSSSGSTVTSNDDYSGTNSRITQTLSAGTYTVEATSYDVSSGPFALQISGSSGGGSGGSCQSAAALNQSISGTLDSSCNSAHASGRYAKYFTFTVGSSTAVTIDMSSSSFDTYLYLLSGSGSGGSVLASNDDYSGTDSHVGQTLAAGTYTIEATSYGVATGPFSVRIAGSSSGGGSSGCTTQVGTNQSVSGSLDSACASIHRGGSYAKYFTFTLATMTSVTVDMSSNNFDTYLFLLAGSGSNGSVLTSNDDADGTNSHITQSLNAGSYTIEATSYLPASGSFGLQIAVGTTTTSLIRVFVLHGIGQTASDMHNLGVHLAQALPSNRFVVNDGFTYCASCNSTCTLENGGRALATYIADHSDTNSDVILIGYSMGGLIAREAILRNYGGVFSGRRVRGLITLGTPNGGFPYCDRLDPLFRCPSLELDMASQLRLSPPIFSSALFSLYTGWNDPASLAGQPGYWLAAAGTFCNEALRSPACDWNDVNDSLPNGCPADSPANDGVVCSYSALYYFGANHLPSERWSNSNYVHTSISLFDCSASGVIYLYDPPPTSTLFIRMVEVMSNVM